jgi:uncharacterized membrane protein
MRPDEPSGHVSRTNSPVALAAAIVGILLVSALLRFPRLAAERLWFDEVFSVVLSLQGIPELLRRALADQTNPPGFYLLLGAWVRAGGVGEAWLRALPALAGALTPAAVIGCTRAFGLAWQPALVAGALAAVSPLLIDKSLEVRAYSVLALAGTLATAQVIRVSLSAAEPRARGYLLLAALHVALVMLHYFGVLTVLALTVAGMFATRELGAGEGNPRRARRTLLAAVPALVLFAAWLGLVAAASRDSGLAGNAAWITAPSVATLPSFASEVIGTFGIAAASWVVLALLLGVALWAAGRARTARTSTLLAAALLPLALAFGVGWLSGRPFWVARYLIATLPPLLILVAMAIDRLPRPWRTGAIALTVGWATLAGMHSIGDRPHKADWVTVLEELSRDETTVLCVNEPYVSLPLEYYALRERLPVTVLDMRNCAPSAARYWAVYRPGTEASLGALVARGGRLGPRVSLVTELPETEARMVDWTR